MIGRGTKVWLDAGGGRWLEASYEFRVEQNEPLGQHSVFLADGGGRRVVCGCKLRDEPPTPVAKEAHAPPSDSPAASELVHYSHHASQPYVRFACKDQDHYVSVTQPTLPDECDVAGCEEFGCASPAEAVPVEPDVEELGIAAFIERGSPIKRWEQITQEERRAWMQGAWHGYEVGREFERKQGGKNG